MKPVKHRVIIIHNTSCVWKQKSVSICYNKFHMDTSRGIQIIVRINDTCRSRYGLSMISRKTGWRLVVHREASPTPNGINFYPFPSAHLPHGSSYIYSVEPQYSDRNRCSRDVTCDRKVLSIRLE